MATPNYSYEKRQRELEKKRKKEEKLRRKGEQRSDDRPAQDGNPDNGAPPQPQSPDGSGQAG